MKVVVLCVLWICWCFLHSLLITPSVLSFIQKQAPGLNRFYRLLYNGLSLLTILPLIIATRAADGQVILEWGGYAIAVRLLLLCAALLLFTGGAKEYDLGYFLGIKQLRSGEDPLLLSDNGQFSETGVFGIIRHPWYLGSLLFLWSILARYTLPVFLAICILSIYLVIGTMLEERKIIAQYHEAYGRYQQHVSMLFPWKWLKKLWRRR